MAEQEAAARLLPPLGHPALPTPRARPARRLVLPVSPYTDVMMLLPRRQLLPGEWAQLVDILCAMRPGLVLGDEDQAAELGEDGPGNHGQLVSRA